MHNTVCVHGKQTRSINTVAEREYDYILKYAQFSAYTLQILGGQLYTDLLMHQLVAVVPVYLWEKHKKELFVWEVSLYFFRMGQHPVDFYIVKICPDAHNHCFIVPRPSFHPPTYSICVEALWGSLQGGMNSVSLQQKNVIEPTLSNAMVKQGSCPHGDERGRTHFFFFF